MTIKSYSQTLINDNFGKIFETLIKLKHNFQNHRDFVNMISMIIFTMTVIEMKLDSCDHDHQLVIPEITKKSRIVWD